MNSILKKTMAVMIAIVVVVSAIPNMAFADSKGEFLVSNYEIISSKKPITSITKDNTVNIRLIVKYAGDASTIDFSKITANRLVDSFRAGKCTVGNVNAGEKTFEVLVENITYKGTGNLLNTLINSNGDSARLSVPITECVEYQPDNSGGGGGGESHPTPQPVLTIRRNDIGSLLTKNQEITVLLTVKNTGTTTVKNPILNLNVSDSLILMANSYSQQLPNISPGKEETVPVRIKATEKIASQNQFIEAEVKFTYHNTISVVEGSSSGKIAIPAKVTEDKKDDKDEIANATPNVIIGNYDFGGASIPAGSTFVLNVSLLNTSRKIDIENVVATVQVTGDFTINGSINTFYFNSVKKGKSAKISIPIKIKPTIESNSVPVGINVKYEYLDLKKRNQGAAELQVSIPVFQKDKFEITAPQIPPMGYVGEESSFTISYNNKGKGTIYNVEASISGDVTSANAKQAVGNIEAGKSGTIAFAYSPNQEGKNKIKVKITYEDIDGNPKKRIFTQTINTEAMPDEEPPADDMPGEEDSGKKFPWLPVTIGALAFLTVLIIIIRHRKKKALAKQEAMMWDNWDDSESKEPKETNESKESNGSNSSNDGGNK